MTFWRNIASYFHKYFSIPSISVIDIIEMIIIAVLFYYLIIWFKRTSAWTLVKGILVILIIMLLAQMFNFSTILWIITKTLNVGIIALIIIFQPELRRALEQLGKTLLFRKLAGIASTSEQKISDAATEEIIRAVAELSRTKTGALISIEEKISLSEYEKTGIKLDADISSQLLLNIFIDKTPLHDGAVIIKDGKIAAATCYFPLSASRSLNKKYGTRHRAALGVSEVSDAFTIVVSEETGHISFTVSRMMIEDVSIDELRRRLKAVQDNHPATSWFDKFRKGAKTDEVQDDSSEICNK